MIIKEHVIDFIIKEFGDYNPTTEDILNELGVSENEATEETKFLIDSKVTS
jgi:hypothetical protein